MAYAEKPGEISDSFFDSDNLVNAMFQANPFVNLIFDDKYNLVECNPAAIEYFEYKSKEELLSNLGKRLFESVPEFQPDGSISTPLLHRFNYVRDHGSMEFELEFVFDAQRVPLRFTMKKLAFGQTFAIACYIIDMQSLKQARNELLRRDTLTRQVNNAATRLMAAEPEKFYAVMQRVLKSVGQSLGAGQMFLFQSNKDDDSAATRTYLWDGETAASTAAEQKAVTVNYSDIKQWHEYLHYQRSLNLFSEDILPEYALAIGQKNAKALLLCPVHVSGKLWGFVGISKSREDAPFSSLEEKILQSAGILFVSAISRNENQQSIILAREAALASDRAKSNFLSRMSHEIRTPMNAIIGITTIAQKETDLTRISHNLSRIEMASRQLLGIINDILDMSKIESGKFEIESRPFDFCAMIDSLLSVMKVKVDEKDHSINVIYKKDFNNFFIGDEVRLTQVYLNLLTNAVKFTPNGGKIDIILDYTEHDDGRVTLYSSIRDNGIGISNEQRERLFKSFEQADGSITRRFGGTGLGLAICKSIVNLMGGNIDVESSLGSGATFFFDMDFSWGEKLETAGDKAKAVEDANYFWPDKRILLVEDVEINKEIILSLLEDTAIAIDWAENGFEALNIMKDNGEKYHLVLMDIQMPVMDGIEATTHIRALEGDHAKTVPIIAMTANVFQQDIDKCLAAGMNDHLGKPIDTKILLGKIDEYINKKGD